ncbi:MAG TPA: TetR/AcrR family transcriptional regulator [Candidatus Limnocylindrales bacterium]|nr:TetR/AcrR family transcriptional regulator [Candidatus Limnocylindrales bacterium]
MATKHDQNRAEKRERLVKAGIEAFTEAGYDNTTVSDIVRRAGMTPSTFYNYYRDKDALRDELLETVASQMVAGLATIRRRAQGVEEYVRMACRGLFAAMVQDKTNAMLLKRNLPLLRSMIDSKALAPVYTAIRRDLEGAASQGLVEVAEIDYATAAMRAAALEIGISLLTRPNADVAGAVDFAARMLSAALRARDAGSGPSGS